MSSERSWPTGRQDWLSPTFRILLSHKSPAPIFHEAFALPAGNSGSGQAVYRHMQMINRAKRFQTAFANSLEYAPHVHASFDRRRALSDLLMYPFFLS